MQCPTLPEDWLQVESVFCQRWNFLHALGALDGKHIPIQCSQGGGSLYSNYKGFHSIVLLDLVEGDYKFLLEEVGAAGSTSDAHIFKHTDLRHKIKCSRERLCDPHVALGFFRARCSRSPQWSPGLSWTV